MIKKDMHKCKKCKRKIIPMNLFRFNAKTYLKSWFYISKDNKELINAYNNKILCMSCIHNLKRIIAIDDYKLRHVEHLGVLNACESKKPVLKA